MELKRVVVTGLGAITPIGNTIPEFWESLVGGVSGSGPVTHFDTTNFRTKFACELKDFVAEEHFEKKEAHKYDPYEQYALVVADEALKDSGLDLETEDLDRIGVVWSSGVGGVTSFEEEAKGFFATGNPRFSPFFVPKMISNMASGYISIRYGLRGINYCTSSACASSNTALCDAFTQIRLGKADALLCGGSEAAITACGMGGFNAMRALSTRNDDCERASRPFSASRDGFVLGEGAGCLVLEELEHALARGARIYAEIGGSAMTADAFHMTAPQPEGKGAARVMELALQDAGIDKRDVDYINAHGTSTHAGDIAELKAIKLTFGDLAYGLNISATKSMTGHLLGAAGAVEAIATILAIKNGIVPPTINHEEGDDDPEIDYQLNLTFNKAQKRDIKAALSNTFGFGGHNASIAFKKWEGR